MSLQIAGFENEESCYISSSHFRVTSLLTDGDVFFSVSLLFRKRQSCNRYHLSRSLQLLSRCDYSSPQFQRIPPEFMKNFKNTNPFKSTLRTPDERSWQVDVIKIEKYLFFENGWQELVQYYSLEKGDFLVFYYNGYAQFDMTIFGLDSRPKKPPTCTDSKEIQENIQDPETAVNSNNPSFELVMNSSYINKGFLIIPVGFWRSYMCEDRDTAKLNHSNRSWDVKITRYPNKIVFTAGWTYFVADNCLRENLICKFELISTTDNVFNVTIHESGEF